MTIRIATFNANNLFSRWSFAAEAPRAVTAEALPTLRADARAGALRGAAEAGGGPAGDDVVRVLLADGTELTGLLRTFRGNLVRGKNPKDRAWIARRIAALGADVLGLQEIEDQAALDAFCRDDLRPAGIDYPYRVVVEGNDPRRIDVAVCSRLPIRRISSWRFWPGPDGAPVFGRDLLQAEVLAPGGRPLHVFVNHLKSNFIADEFRLSADQVAAEREAIARRRTHQAEAIAAILRRQRLTRRVVVLGDLNDAPDAATLSALTGAGLREHIGAADTIPGPDRAGRMRADAFAGLSGTMWTHRHRAGGAVSFGLYDHVWTSPDVPVTGAHVMRRTQISGDGTDHDPACVDVDL